MLFMRLQKYRLVTQEFFSSREQADIFVIGMGFQEFVPCEAIANESGLVCCYDMWCLMVDRIVSSEDGVMDHTHVTRTRREEVMLIKC